MPSRPLSDARPLRRSAALASIAAAAAAGLVCPARAQNVYGGIDLGHPQYSNQINGIGGDDGTNGGIGAKVYGGYSLTPNFALEGSLFRLGHGSSNGQTVNTWGGAIDAVGTYGFAPQWSLLGRVGLAEARFDTSAGDDSSSGLKFGAGVQYDVNSRVGLRVQYERYHFFNAFGSKPNVGEYSAGVKVSF